MEKAESSTVRDFLDALSGKSPTPGGGGASALTGALAAALCGMVGALTAGKPKYAAVEADILRLNGEAAALQNELLALIDADAAAFLPLSRAYRMPSDTAEERAEKAAVMEAAGKAAVEPPLAIMRCAAAVAKLCGEYAEKGSALAVSDAGTAAALCRAALTGASCNVFVNTGMLTDRAYAARLDAEAQALLDTYLPMADETVRRVTERLKKHD